MTAHAWVRTLASCVAAVAVVGAAQAQTPPPEETLAEAGRPKWEVGVAAGGGYVPDYPGADQSRGRAIVVPMVIYRGPVLRIDQAGIRGRLFNSADWELDLTASAAFNARNNDARQGMPGLDYLFGAGPQLIYKGWARADRGTTLHLKARAVMSTDFRRIDQRGGTVDVELRWRERPWAGSPATLTLSAQPSWATRSLHRYFYEVEERHATAGRPAWRARAGYLGTEFAATITRRQGPALSWFVTARAMALHGAANIDSPLLRDRSNFTLGAGLVWTPWQSRDRVPP
jgi:outer membrane scaffolding protein for murein synthesis (MipA/OmpV family)